jgi:hypothetical protein
MKDDIYSIVERLAILEGRITPTSVKSGLNSQQKSVPQLPALFKANGINVLGNKTDPKHPMHGYAVGSNESVELGEADVAEDMLGQVKKSFADYLQSIEDRVAQDRDIQDRKPDNKEVQANRPSSKGLQIKVATEDATQEDPVIQTPSPVQVNPITAESVPVKTMECGLGMVFEIHGDEHTGFEIRRGNRSLKSRFENLDHAVIACEMFRAKMNRRLPDEISDYIEER